jgi:hypothetical protein
MEGNLAKVILLSGKAQVGKTTTANIIKKHLEDRGKKVLITPFAAYLKFICKEHFKWNGKKDEEGRHILQYVGTDVVRKKVPDFWVKAVIDLVTVFSDEIDYFIVDDCRFVNEIECFNGFDYLALRIERLNFDSSLTPEQLNHISETALDDYPFDCYLKSESGIEYLEQEIYLNLLNHPLWLEWFGLEIMNHEYR